MTKEILDLLLDQKCIRGYSIPTDGNGPIEITFNNLLIVDFYACHDGPIELCANLEAFNTNF